MQSLAIATLVFVSGAAVAAPITVAALEASQCADPPITGVRPLFIKADAGWQPVDAAAVRSLSTGTEWTIALDGKSLGTLRTAATFADTQVLAPAPEQKVPPVGNAQKRFAGWCDAPSRRPLAASSNATTADPDQWKPVKPGSTQIESLLPAFVAQVGPTVLTCKGEVTGNWTYSAGELRLAGAYQDRHGRQLVGIQLDAASNTCDGPPEAGWQAQWFVLIEAAKPAFIGTNLDLVEAVDFDADGASELLLWRSDYNQDGYLLLDGTLKTPVEQQWSYH